MVSPCNGAKIEVLKEPSNTVRSATNCSCNIPVETNAKLWAIPPACPTEILQIPPFPAGILILSTLFNRSAIPPVVEKPFENTFP